MRLLIIALVLLFMVLQYQFWFGKGSVVSAWKMKDHIAVQQQKDKQLKQRNDAIGADIADLKSGNKAIEERARTELGMVKKGESFYQVVKTHESSH